MHKATPFPEMGFEGKDFYSNQNQTSHQSCGVVFCEAGSCVLLGFLGEHCFLEVLGMQTLPAEGWEGLLFSWALSVIGMGKQKKVWFFI